MMKKLTRAEMKAEANPDNILQGINLATCYKVQNGIDKVIRKRCNDCGESAADNYADGHVHHVSAQSKSFKFFDKFFISTLSFRSLIWYKKRFK